MISPVATWMGGAVRPAGTRVEQHDLSTFRTDAEQLRARRDVERARVQAVAQIEGQAELELGTAPLGGTGPQETVLAARMNYNYSPFPNASFPVYTLSSDHGSWWGGAGAGPSWKP